MTEPFLRPPHFALPFHRHQKLPFSLHFTHLVTASCRGVAESEDGRDAEKIFNLGE